MIAPSVMKLIAPPALADKTVALVDDGACAIVVDPEEPGPVKEALATRRLELGAILMTRVARAETTVLDTSAVMAHTAGHIAYVAGAGAAAPTVRRGDTLGRTWKNEFR